MEYTCCVQYTERTVDPEDGQDRLEAMAQAIREGSGVIGAGWGKLEVPGVTREREPYPDWFKKFLSKAEFQYEDFNHTFIRRVKTRQAATDLQTWFEQCREFYKKHTECNAFMEKVTFHIMEPFENQESLETF